MFQADAEFLLSGVNFNQYPKDQLIEVALTGRSNVGKSSFLNSLFKKKKLANVSSTPGKTRTLNFYRVSGRYFKTFYLVDVPGYGFAKVSKSISKSWIKMLEDYYSKREKLRGVIQLVDIRHMPTEDDKIVFNFLKELKKNIIVVATKADKISKSSINKNLSNVSKCLGIEEVIPFSSKSLQGKKEVWDKIIKLVTK